MPSRLFVGIGAKHDSQIHQRWGHSADKEHTDAHVWAPSSAGLVTDFVCAAGGGAQRRAPAQVLSWHHVQSSAAVPRQIHLRPPSGLRQGRRAAQEGRELLQRQSGSGVSLRRQEASAHGKRVVFFVLALEECSQCRYQTFKCRDI